MNSQDDDDMLRQMRIYTLDRTNYYALFITVPLHVKLNYLEASACHFKWTAYKKSTFDKLRVAFNNAYRRY